MQSNASVSVCKEGNGTPEGTRCHYFGSSVSSTASLQAGMFALPYNRGKGKAQSLSALDAEITLEAP